jgi:heme-degrading monooxygenase HmoA
MIVVANRIPVAKGYEKEFEKRFENRFGVQGMKGFVRFELLRPLQGSDYYVVKTYWETPEDFHAWTQSDAFKQAHASRPPAEMFAGPNVFEMHEVVMQTETLP